MLQRTTLRPDWTLHLATAADGAPAEFAEFAGSAGTGIAATVPGTVHTDLISAKLLDNPDVGEREKDQHWIGASAWEYRTTVSQPVDPGERTELVFEGLDTHAEVFLDDVRLGETKNMHRRYRFDVTGLLTGAEHTLRVVFHPIGHEVDRVRDEVGFLPATEAIHYPYVRKMACNFGWDWGPVYITAGIWRPVYLESWSGARLEDVAVLATLDGDAGQVSVNANVRTATDVVAHSLDVTVRDASGAVVATQRHDGVDVAGLQNLTFTVPQVQAWWPVGMGDQPLYDVSVELLDGAGAVVDSRSRRVGFRSVSITQEPDEQGTRWQTVINGRPVNIRGFNWIPDLPFPSAVDAGRYERRIDQALAANANMLRVWGGGIYEEAAFYEACDAKGVLVWQDFLFACAAYPETPEYIAEVEAEARQAITDRAHHPSLILWNANNECTWGYHDWGWQEKLEGRPWGAHYYGELLPRVVGELDPTRPYIPGSPSSGDLQTAPNDDGQGPSHLWDVWNQIDMVHYRDRTPAFAAEFGFCGPPTHATLRSVVPEGELTLDNPVVRHHLRAADGPAKLAKRIAEHFPQVPAQDWVWIAQVNQARALILGVDHLRALPRCSGAVVWQLNDCWPVISWAAVDSGERLKPLWYALRSAFAPRGLSIQPTASGLSVNAVNDGESDWAARVSVQRVGFDGEVLSEGLFELSAPIAGVASAELPSELAVPGDSAAELLVVSAEGAEQATWFWERDKDLAYPLAQFDATATPTSGGLDVQVTARTLVRDLTLLPDLLTGADGKPLPPQAAASVALVTLLPGQSVTIHVPLATADQAEQAVSAPVLRAVNDSAALSS